ncbi:MULTISPECIES: CGNR zinc finger domain-containing protein [Actinopolyspora]|uniref:CGNR zinc finger domain-containing protein n=1 Tax=Actinopolyspora saharensis TaxID=995062 RepID=A0A1H1AVZ8_9ACTN|nr:MULTISPECIES: CGNR zinc finger domain-containing protein [Actinopolyspora]NHD17167.1 CGNR zinc finger domain-containing protein [Actinopolyspora sp. BKK2]NHE76319.1 CGNR zinc finger domain-containing protein [Actinopolyspora sp. BKK1]SDQ43908.1 CGNR zinc finger domain-containing protein [Actinopolyspora saharensis]
MDNADYITGALRLANARTDDLEALRAELHDEPWWCSRLTEQDLRTLHRVAAELRQSLEAAVFGEHETLHAEVNRLLATYPPRPRLSREGPEQHREWHIHIAEVEAPPAHEIAAAAAWGLAQGIVRHGTERWGRCEAPNCGTYFLDTSTNRTRQFCSARCANRVHVAAFRQRRRA